MYSQTYIFLYYQFSRHHQKSHTQLANVHVRDNLVTLCSICHFAFDLEECAFFPADMEDWADKLKTEPHLQLEYISQRNIKYLRVLLQADVETKAALDKHYRNAFTEKPVKAWHGEPGVLIIKNHSTLALRVEDTHFELLKSYQELKSAWFSFNSPCALENCKLCKNSQTKDEGTWIRS